VTTTAARRGRPSWTPCPSAGNRRRATRHRGGLAARDRVRRQVRVLFTNTLLIWLQHAEAYEQGRAPTPEPNYVAGFRQHPT
jgi:hypothetical protein